MWNFSAFFIPALQLIAAYGAAQQESLQNGLQDAGVTVFFPGSSGYANASQPCEFSSLPPEREISYYSFTVNLRFTPEPAAVAYPSNAQEVSQIVKLGNEAGVAVVARSGGHSYIANGLGGDSNGTLVIDLSNLRTITIDDSSKNAVIQPGSRLGDVALALNDKGRGIPHGSCAYVGVGGHAAFGGFGYPSRMWGLTLDAVVSIEVVLANGTITTASETEQPDLFWALRGAAPTFGIITSYTFKTFPVPDSGLIFSYAWTFNSTYAATVLLHFQDLFKTADLPGEFSTEIVLTPGPKKGEVNLSFVGAWYGDKNKLDDITKPFLDGLPPRRDESVGGGNWLESVENLAGGSLDTKKPDSTDTFYAKSLVLTQESGGFSDDAAKAFMTFLGKEGIDFGSFWFLQIELYGGSNSAITSVPKDATSFAWRNALFNIQFYASSDNAKPPYPDSGFTVINGMVDSITKNSPEGTVFGAYTNYVEDKLPDWQHRYYNDHYSRLQGIKKQVDPRNTFRFLTSIELP
jgi:hypothetical protein